MCLLLWKFVLRLSKRRTTSRIKSCQTWSIQNSYSAFEVTLNSSRWSQNTSKPGRRTPICSISCMGMCHWYEGFQCPGWHTPNQHLTESPPGLTDEDRYCISYTAVLLTFDISHDITFVTSLAKNCWYPHVEFKPPWVQKDTLFNMLKSLHTLFKMPDPENHTLL